MSPCNYCSAMALRRQADGAGLKITHVPEPKSEYPDGVAIYRHPPGTADPKAGGQKMGWYEDMPDHCVCKE